MSSLLTCVRAGGEEGPAHPGCRAAGGGQLTGGGWGMARSCSLFPDAPGRVDTFYCCTDVEQMLDFGMTSFLECYLQQTHIITRTANVKHDDSLVFTASNNHLLMWTYLLDFNAFCPVHIVAFAVRGKILGVCRRGWLKVLSILCQL